MQFNDKWTKIVNDEYRQMIKDGKSMDDIRNHFTDLLQYHPNDKFKSIGLFSYGRFLDMINEIKFHPNYVPFEFKYIQSLRFKKGKDILCFFKVNNIDYVVVLEYLIEKNEFFDNEVVYNIFLEKDPNSDTIQIFNSLSYILLKMINHIENPIYIISNTTNHQKIIFYKKSIEDSFKEEYELKIGKSLFFDDLTYYYIIKNGSIKK